MSTPSNPDCHAMIARISAYLDGELDPPACDAIELHCQTCSSCAAIVEGLQRTVGLCREASAAPLPDVVRERARASLRLLLDTPPPDRG